MRLNKHLITTNVPGLGLSLGLGGLGLAEVDRTDVVLSSNRR